MDQMMGGSCSMQLRSQSQRDGRIHQRGCSGSSLRRGGSRISHFCGGGDDDSTDKSHISSKRTHRATRHSVDAEIPNNSISQLYPPQDNYIPHSNGTRSPKSLVDLCISSLCRSLPNFDELPPGLPRELVDRILASLTSHGALNSTTLRCLRHCEFSELSLASCRGVSDEWFRSASREQSIKRRSLSPVTKTVQQRPRSVSMPCRDLSVASSSLKCSHYGASTPSPDFLDVSSSMMDIDDECQDSCSSPHVYVEKRSEEEQSSSSSASFVSALFSPYNGLSTSSSHYGGEVAKERLSSSLLPRTLPSPDIFSIEPKPVFQNPCKNDVCVALYSSLIRQSLPIFPVASSIYMEEGVSHDHISEHSVQEGYHSSLTVLDLRCSRITDQGLLRLSKLSPLSSLEVVKLDSCHGITGQGLIAFAHSKNLHTLTMANCRRVTDEAVVNVSHLRRLSAVNLGGCRCLTNRSLESFAGLLELRKLDLSQCDLITDKGLSNFDKLESIEELSLGWCRQVSDEGISILAKQPNRSRNLRVLRLARCTITDKGLQHIGVLSNLKELDLNGCIHISSAALAGTLTKLVKLNSLDVSYCPGILRSSWQGKINRLKSLELCYSRVSDTHMSRLTKLPALEELNLDSCSIGDWTIAHLADNNVIPNIMSLDLADTDLSDIGMAKIPQFKTLRKLSLFYCNISNTGLRHLSTLTNLEELNLDSRDIGDDGIKHLRYLPLKSLDLFSSRVTDLGCAFLSKIKTLVNLELCGGSIGDLGCAHLGTLSNLESLNLSQNERITNAGAATLATLANLKALNLSNTGVTPDALKFFNGLLKLQSLALYGCKDMIDSPDVDSLQSELPLLKCLRLNGDINEDGIINHDESDSDDTDIAEDDDDTNSTESGNQESILLYHGLKSEDSSDEEIDDFQDAHYNHDETDSFDDTMSDD